MQARGDSMRLKTTPVVTPGACMPSRAARTGDVPCGRNIPAPPDASPMNAMCPDDEIVSGPKPSNVPLPPGAEAPSTVSRGDPPRAAATAASTPGDEGRLDGNARRIEAPTTSTRTGAS
jgi:hypothetical protein